MKTFTSAGCFTIYEKDKTAYVLLIHNTRDKDIKGWVPPKGRIERDESPGDAAIRETKEETGIKKISLTRYVSSTSYDFVCKERTVKKKVHWYLAKSSDGILGNTKLTKDEKKYQDEVGWIEINKAIKLLKHTNEKKILKKIKTIINSDLS